ERPLPSHRPRGGKTAAASRARPPRPRLARGARTRADQHPTGLAPREPPTWKKFLARPRLAQWRINRRYCDSTPPSSSEYPNCSHPNSQTIAKLAQPADPCRVGAKRLFGSYREAGAPEERDSWKLWSSFRALLLLGWGDE